MTKKPMRVSEFGQRVGRSDSTIRRWDRNGLLVARRTESGQRYYTEDDVAKALRLPMAELSSTIVYLRVSSPGQKDDLESQRSAMEQFCLAAGIEVDEWVVEIGSGLNFKRKKLLDILDRAIDGERITLVVAHKDRLARFGIDLIEHIITRRSGQLRIVNQESLSPHAELVQDILAILHVFSSRLYGLRRYEKKIKAEING